MDSMEQIAQTSRVEYCTVCGDQADGYHYGVLSCRGCNAFFRRAVTYDLQFQCRRGGNCVIDRNARCACRACRLNKCKTVGMDRSAVQVCHDKEGQKLSPIEFDAKAKNGKWSKNGASNNSVISPPIPSVTALSHRNSIPAAGIGISTVCSNGMGGLGLAGPAAADRRNYVEAHGADGRRNSGGSGGGAASALAMASPYSAFTPIFSGGGSEAVCASSSRTPSSLSGKSPLSAAQPNWLIHVFGSAAALAAMPSTFLSPNSDASSGGFLTRLAEEYFDQRRRRRSMLCTTLEEVLNDNVEIRFGTAAGVNDVSAIYQVQMILMFEWVEKLSQFHQIESAYDKVRLLRAFSLKYLLLDNLIYTLELGRLDRLVLVNNNFVQPGYPPPPMDNCAPSDAHRALALMYGENSIKIIEDLIKPMAEMNITFAEFMILRLLLLWNPGAVGLSSQTSELIKKASEQALQELHAYFETNKTLDLRNRLGTVLLFLSPLAKHTQNLIEITSLIPGFGILPEWDSFMNDLLRS